MSASSTLQLVKTIVHAGECQNCEQDLDRIACYPDNSLRVITENTADAHRALTLLLARGIDPNEGYKYCTSTKTPQIYIRTPMEHAATLQNFEAIRNVSNFGGNFDFFRKRPYSFE